MSIRQTMPGKKRVNDEAFEKMVEGSFRFRTAQHEEDDDDMDDELAHLADTEEVLRQELDSIHVVADPAVTSPRLSSASLLDLDHRRNDKDSTMSFSSSSHHEPEATTHHQHGQG